MRFSLHTDLNVGGIVETILLNLSETGLAFLVKPGSEPMLGDRIKVEIPIPSGEQIAWFGRVVRIQEHQPTKWNGRKYAAQVERQILVGLKFEELPTGHSRTLRRGIEASFINAAREQQYRSLAYYKTFALHNFPAWILYFALAAAAVGFIYYFSLPSANYDSKRGAPWGERF